MANGILLLGLCAELQLPSKLKMSFMAVFYPGTRQSQARQGMIVEEAASFIMEEAPSFIIPEQKGFQF